jgi:hypothetical protein
MGYKVRDGWYFDIPRVELRPGFLQARSEPVLGGKQAKGLEEHANVAPRVSVRESVHGH